MSPGVRAAIIAFLATMWAYHVGTAISDVNRGKTLYAFTGLFTAICIGWICMLVILA